MPPVPRPLHRYQKAPGSSVVCTWCVQIRPSAPLPGSARFLSDAMNDFFQAFCLSLGVFVVCGVSLWMARSTVVGAPAAVVGRKPLAMPEEEGSGGDWREG
jgi:hypothetical protein